MGSQLDKPEKLQKYFEYKINLLNLNCELNEKQKIEECYLDIYNDKKTPEEILISASEIVFKYYMYSEKQIDHQVISPIAYK